MFTGHQAHGLHSQSVCTMPHTEGIDNVVIFWDDDDGEYNAGQLLTGRIEVEAFLGDFIWIFAF